MTELEERLVRIIVRDSFDHVSRSGSVFHKQTEEQAREIAPLVVAAARTNFLYIWYLAGNIGWESRWDPLVDNPNGRVPPRVEATDYGMAQRNGANLLAEARKLRVPVTDLIAKAHDPYWAIPWMGSEYRRLVRWAKDPNPATETGEPRFPGSDPLYVGTMAYNKGRVGAESIVKNDRGILNAYRAPEKQMGPLEFVLYKRSGHKHARSVMNMAYGYRRELMEP